MSQSVLILGTERRRRFTAERKLQILSEAFGPGGNVANVAAREDVCSSLLYRWRKSALANTQSAPLKFHQAVLPSPPPDRRPAEPAVIMVEFASGVRVKVRASAPPALVSAALKALS